MSKKSANTDEALAIGLPVQVTHSGNFYMATIRERRHTPEGWEYLVRYDGWGAGADEWKTAAEVKSIFQTERPRRQSGGRVADASAHVTDSPAAARGMRGDRAGASGSKSAGRDGGSAAGKRRRGDDDSYTDEPGVASDRKGGSAPRSASKKDEAVLEGEALLLSVQAAWATSNAKVRSALLQGLLANCDARHSAEVATVALKTMSPEMAQRETERAIEKVRADWKGTNSVEARQHFLDKLASLSPSAEIRGGVRCPVSSMFVSCVVWHKVEAWQVEDFDLVVPLLAPFARQLFPYDAELTKEGVVEWDSTCDATDEGDASASSHTQTLERDYHAAFFRLLRCTAHIATLHHCVLLCRAILNRRAISLTTGSTSDIRTAAELETAIIVHARYNLVSKGSSPSSTPSAAERPTTRRSAAAPQAQSSAGGSAAVVTTELAVKPEPVASSLRSSDTEIVADFGEKRMPVMDSDARAQAHAALGHVFALVEKQVKELLVMVTRPAAGSSAPVTDIMDIAEKLKKLFALQRNNIATTAEKACVEWQRVHRRAVVAASSSAVARKYGSLLLPAVKKHMGKAADDDEAMLED